MHITCARADRHSSFDAAAQSILTDPAFADAITVSLEELKRCAPEKFALLAETFNTRVLTNEIRWRLTTLADVALRPLAKRLRERGVTGITLIPCGALATFPILGAPIRSENDAPLSEQWPTFADAFPNGASVAPSARALIRDEPMQRKRHGLRAIGNPTGAGVPLRWAQAEALTLAQLAGDIGAARILGNATRQNVIADMKEALIYEASCHGNSSTGNYLDYGLYLANGERLSLRDIFDGQITDLRGLRLFILSACQTGILDLRGARDEVRSLAVGLLQAGSEAVLASQWSVNDRATYLLIVRFFQIWQQSDFHASPAVALARAQRWLRNVTWGELRTWQGTKPLPSIIATMPDPDPTKYMVAVGSVKGARTRNGEEYVVDATWPEPEDAEYAALRTHRYSEYLAQEVIQALAENMPEKMHPFAHPFYWAGFSITGW